MEFPKTSGIYMIRNSQNGKCYVGQSDNVKRRVEAHERALRHNIHYNQYLQRSWNKYGYKNFEFVLLEECDKASLDEREIFYIDYFGSYRDGYNMNIGGNSNRGYKYTDEDKQKMRDNHWDCSGENNPMFGHSVQEYMTDEAITAWKRNISSAVSGCNNPFYGKKHTDAFKQRMSATRKGIPTGEKCIFHRTRRTPEFNEKLAKSLVPFYERNRGANHCNAKKIVCLNTGAEFECIADASMTSGVHRSAISMCCSGKTNSAGTDDRGQRLVWSYLDQYMLMSKNDIAEKIRTANTPKSGENSKLSKAVICLNTGEVFGSARAAAQYYGIDFSSLCKACRGKSKTCGKHPDTGEKLRWAYYNNTFDGIANHM